MLANKSATNVKTVREWRAYRRMTKSEAAKAVGVTPPTYTRMENNPSDISIRASEKLASIFQCDVREINFFD